MAHVTVNGVRLGYSERGSGPETVVLSHSYLVDRRQFDAQVEALAPHYRVLAYDHRGHGESDRPGRGYDVETLYADAVAFIEQTGAAPCHFVGLSTGGFVGMRLGYRRPDLLESLVLMDTSADAEPLAARAKYEAMFAVLLGFGFEPLMGATMPILFGPSFLGDPARQGEVREWRRRIAAGDRRALVRFGHGIFSRPSVLDRLSEISVPTLVMVGEHDCATPPLRAQRIADGIAGAQLSLVRGAGHLSTVENPDAVNRALSSFFADRSVDARDGAARTPRSTTYDGAVYGRVVEPLLAGVHDFVLKHLPTGERVLDACCGTGGLSRKLMRNGRQVVGVDLSPRNIDYARRQTRGENPRYELGDVTRLDAFSSAQFDVATVVMALHEMPQAARVPALRELARVARKVVVVDFAAPMPRNFAGLRNRVVEFAAGREHFGAFRDYSRRGGLARLVPDAGLAVEWERTIDSGTLRVQVLSSG